MEIFVGATPEQKEFWESIFDKLIILPINESEINTIIQIIKQLRKDNKIIDIADILIASTAISVNLELVTLNLKHFNRIDNLQIKDI